MVRDVAWRALDITKGLLTEMNRLYSLLMSSNYSVAISSFLSEWNINS